MFSARIQCKCGYDFLLKQTDEKITIWSAQKLMNVHEASCSMGCQITFSNDEK